VAIATPLAEDEIASGVPDRNKGKGGTEKMALTAAFVVVVEVLAP